MKENKITIIIDRPVAEVFGFTTDPKNTPLWVPSIQEEVSDGFPPKIGTRYKNRGEDSEWVYCTVLEYEPLKKFTLTDMDANYHVRYTYRRLDDDRTEMEYLEWMESGELKDTFTQDILDTLKAVMERR